ncbi:hypothetical protein [Actinomadura hibisca]|uniref:hypothetical protein n=1 Tax=Actinomadura hibisca TaxID=68565 RepID=UPI000A7CE7C7|nr:hypothetical protein [Actinomadura hibisca]
MRNGTFRAIAGVLLLAGGGLLTGCGGGDNSDKVCADAKQAFQQYVTQVQSAPANKSEPWKQATEQLAGKIDGLAAKAEKAELKKALKDEANRFRTAAGPVGSGDVSQLDQVLKSTPEQIGKACS